MRQYIQYIFLVLSFGSVSDFLEMSKFAWILLVIAFDPTGQNEIFVQDVSFLSIPCFAPHWQGSRLPMFWPRQKNQ